MSYFLGIDSSTTATKALLMDADGQLIHVTTATYSYQTPQPLWSEQAPQRWWQATTITIQKLIQESGVTPQAVQAIGLTGQMHGLVLLDKDGTPLRPAILWNDQRTAVQCDEMRHIFGKAQLIATTGNDALTGFTAPKILWVKQHEPAIYDQIAHILLPKDYVRYKLTGNIAMDRAGGAGTQLFNLQQRNWSSTLLQALDINPDWLPTTFEGTDITGQLTQSAAKACGLVAGIPVVGGGGDQAANAVGTGAVVDGIVALSLGTSGVIFASTDQPIIEPNGRLHAFCHAVPHKWHLMGVMLSAAGSLRWYHDTIAPNSHYDTLLQPAAQIPAGCEGLFFLPYLTGERTPHPDPLARGAFIGLTVRHTQAHLTRSVLEGVAFGLKDSFELMKGAGLPPITQIRASGGGSQSQLWRQILADVLETEIVSINTTEGAAYGAAILAAVGVGSVTDVPTACAEWVRVTDKTAVSPQTTQYQQQYSHYRTLYPTLKETFAAISNDQATT